MFDDRGPSTKEYARHCRPWNWTLVPSSRRAPNITAARTEFVYTWSLKSDKEVCAIEFPEPSKGQPGAKAK